MADDDYEPIAVASNTPARRFWLQVRPSSGGEWRNLRQHDTLEPANTDLANQRSRSTSDWEFRVA